MKNISGIIGKVMIGCVLVTALYSCKNNESTNGSKCADSTAAATTSTTTATTTTDTTAMANAGAAGNAANNTTGKTEMESTRMRENNNTPVPNEPSLGGNLVVTSTAFSNMGVIPVKYTCDGQGATPPINVTNIPKGTKSLTLMIHDYNATPGQGLTFWIIWNLDTTGKIPEDFRSSHENLNAAKQYGYTPICAKSGSHRYHFMVYALDTKLVLGKTTTMPIMESVMKGHILDKGELVGIYNKRLE